MADDRTPNDAHELADEELAEVAGGKYITWDYYLERNASNQYYLAKLTGSVGEDVTLDDFVLTLASPEQLKCRAHWIAGGSPRKNSVYMWENGSVSFAYEV